MSVAHWGSCSPAYHISVEMPMFSGRTRSSEQWLDVIAAAQRGGNPHSRRRKQEMTKDFPRTPILIFNFCVSPKLRFSYWVKRRESWVFLALGTWPKDSSSRHVHIPGRRTCRLLRQQSEKKATPCGTNLQEAALGQNFIRPFLAMTKIKQA